MSELDELAKVIKGSSIYDFRESPVDHSELIDRDSEIKELTAENKELEADVVRLSVLLAGTQAERNVAQSMADDLTAENARLQTALDATWEALDGLYGADRGEVIPIELLPEDRQQLFHKALELVGAVLDGREEAK